jgi:hypothetical protein
MVMPLPRSKNWVSGLRPTTEQGTNPKDQLGMLKVPMGLVSPIALAIESICMVDGDEKYGPYNYRVSKVQAWIYLQAALRHIYAIMDGQDFDRVTGKPHIGYARATLGIYCDAWVTGNLIDNRPLKGLTGEIIDAFSRTGSQPEFTPGEMTEKLLALMRNHEEAKSAKPKTQNHPTRRIKGRRSRARRPTK